MSDETQKDLRILDIRIHGEELKRLSDLISSLQASLIKIQAVQPAALRMIESNGFKFDSIGAEPGNWQHLAFALYTDLCEIETIARNALSESE